MLVIPNHAHLVDRWELLKWCKILAQSNLGCLINNKGMDRVGCGENVELRMGEHRECAEDDRNALDARTSPLELMTSDHVPVEMTIDVFMPTDSVKRVHTI